MPVRAKNPGYQKSHIPMMHDSEVRFDTTYTKIHNGEKAEAIGNIDALKSDLRCIDLT